MAPGYLLGIDVGTTRTAAAICRTGARPADPEIVNLGDRSSAVPSVLYLGDDGVVVGAAAERRATSDPDHIVREFKRRVGDPTPLVIGGRAWQAEELSALLAQWVVERVAQREGGPAARLAVTHPASWGAHKKDLLAAALRHHGLHAAFLAEPQAAAVHYAAAERVEPDSTIAVYDFGGGTFDAAVLHKDPLGFSLIGRPEGVERLGGIDLDELVFEHVVEGLPAAFDGLDESDPAVLSAVAAVRRECTEAKEALSADTEVAIRVLTPAGRGSVRLHRTEFETMIRPHVEETVVALRRAIGSAGVAVEELTAVLLVGGSSRIPLVAQMVSEGVGRPVAVDADPKDAIAKGAALSLTFAGISTTGTQGRQAGGTGRHAAAAPVTVALSGAVALTGAQQAASARYDDDFAEPSTPTERISTPPSIPPARPPVSERPVAGSAAAGFAEAGAAGGSATYGPAAGEFAPGEFAEGEEEPDFAYAVPPPQRRSPALLVGAGGTVAALAVLAVVFLIPRSAVSTAAGLDTPPSVVATSTAPVPTTSSAPTTTTAPATSRTVERTTPREVPPLVTTTLAVVPTTLPPPTAVTKTTVTATTTTTTKTSTTTSAAAGTTGTAAPAVP